MQLQTPHLTGTGRCRYAIRSLIEPGEPNDDWTLSRWQSDARRLMAEFVLNRKLHGQFSHSGGGYGPCLHWLQHRRGCDIGA